MEETRQLYEDPKRSDYTRRIYKQALQIIGQNNEVKLSKEVLLQLREAGLRLIPQLRFET